MEKPVTLRIKELKRDIASCVNGSMLPAFIVDYVLSEIKENVSKAAEEQAFRQEKEYYDAINKNKDGDSDEQSI